MTAKNKVPRSRCMNSKRDAKFNGEILENFIESQSRSK